MGTDQSTLKGGDTSRMSQQELRDRRINRLDNSTREKLSRVQDLNLKITIRGARRTGKTSLVRRLMSKGFSDSYTPTPAIRTCNLEWSYRVRDFTCKLELWDIVDKARSTKKGSDAIRITAEDEADDEATIAPPTSIPTRPGSYELSKVDARIVDVYRGAHGVVLMFNPQFRATWDYIKKEIWKIPKHLFILIVSNFKDMNPENCKVPKEEINTFVEVLAQDGLRVAAIEASMLNQYGLDGIRTYINVPFLDAQRKAVEQRLQQLRVDFDYVLSELNYSIEHQNYDFYIQKLKELRKKQDDSGTPIPISSIRSHPSPARLSSPPTSPTPTSTMTPPALSYSDPPSRSTQQPLSSPTTDTPPEISPASLRRRQSASAADLHIGGGTPPAPQSSVPNIRDRISKSDKGWVNSLHGTPVRTNPNSKMEQKSSAEVDHDLTQLSQGRDLGSNQDLESFSIGIEDTSFFGDEEPPKKDEVKKEAQRVIPQGSNELNGIENKTGRPMRRNQISGTQTKNISRSNEKEAETSVVMGDLDPFDGDGVPEEVEETSNRRNRRGRRGGGRNQSEETRKRRDEMRLKREERKREQQQAEDEKNEKEREEKERRENLLKKKQEEREQIEKEQREKEKQERERVEREKEKREKEKREKGEREKEERKREEKEREEREERKREERVARERQEKEKEERERIEKEKKEKEAREMKEEKGNELNQEIVQAEGEESEKREISVKEEEPEIEKKEIIKENIQESFPQVNESGASAVVADELREEFENFDVGDDVDDVDDFAVDAPIDDFLGGSDDEKEAISKNVVESGDDDEDKNQIMMDEDLSSPKPSPELISKTSLPVDSSPPLSPIVDVVVEDKKHQVEDDQSSVAQGPDEEMEQPRLDVPPTTEDKTKLESQESLEVPREGETVEDKDQSTAVAETEMNLKAASVDMGSGMSLGTTDMAMDMGTTMTFGTEMGVGTSMDMGTTMTFGTEMGMGTTMDMGTTMEMGSPINIGSTDMGTSMGMGSTTTTMDMGMGMGSSLSFETSMDMGMSMGVGMDMGMGNTNGGGNESGNPMILGNISDPEDEVAETKSRERRRRPRPKRSEGDVSSRRGGRRNREGKRG